MALRVIKRQPASTFEQLHMKVEKESLSKIKPHPMNTRLHDEDNILAIMESLRKFGQQRPIVVGKDNLILAGCGTWEAATRLGWRHINIFRTQLSGDDALAYSIADNKTTDMSRFDWQKLAVVMDKLEKSKSIEVTGFKDFEAAPLLGRWKPPEIAEMPVLDDKVKTWLEFSEDDWATIILPALAHFKFTLRLPPKTNDEQVMVEWCRRVLDVKERNQ